MCLSGGALLFAARGCRAALPFAILSGEMGSGGDRCGSAAPEKRGGAGRLPLSSIPARRAFRRISAAGGNARSPPEANPPQAQR